MSGFGFIEYKDAMDARDVVPGKLISHKVHLQCPTVANRLCLQLSVGSGFPTKNLNLPVDKVSANRTVKMDLPLWASALPSSLPVAHVTAKAAPAAVAAASGTMTALLRDHAALLTACKYLVYLVIPAGRSVNLLIPISRTKLGSLWLAPLLFGWRMSWT